MRDLAEQVVELAGLVVEYLQRVVSLDPDAEHGDGEQVLGGELVGDVLLVAASADSLEVGAGVACAACGAGGEVSLHQAGGEVLVAELAGNVDGHDASRGAGSWDKWFWSGSSGCGMLGLGMPSRAAISRGWIPGARRRRISRRATASISGWVITSASTASGPGTVAARRRCRSCQRSVSAGCQPASSHCLVMSWACR